MKRLFLLIAITISIVLLPSCVTNSGPYRSVNVVQDNDANTRNDQTGDWNDADLRDSAKTLINQMLTEQWYKKAVDAKGGVPTVKIGKIKNKTDVHLPMVSFRDSIEKTLINSGKLTFVSSSNDTNYIRKNRDEEMKHVSDESAKEDGSEVASDYMLLGQFTSMSDRLGGREVRYLQINLRLIDTEKNIIVWIGEKKIKKFIRQKSRTW